MLRVPKMFNLRTDPFERADITSNTYWDWYWTARTCVCRRSDIVAEFLEHVPGVPTAHEGGELHDRPGAGEARGGDRVRALTGGRPPLVERRAGEEAVLEFVERVTASGSAGFVPPPARVAVLDNDGTLWCERPDLRPGVLHPRPAEGAGSRRSGGGRRARSSRRCSPVTSNGRRPEGRTRSSTSCSGPMRA